MSPRRHSRLRARMPHKLVVDSREFLRRMTMVQIPPGVYAAKRVAASRLMLFNDIRHVAQDA